MIRVCLPPAERDELRSRAHERGIAPSTRDRLELLRLADAGWRIPRIARHLALHQQTVRKHVKAFLAHGFAALPDRARGTPADRDRGAPAGGRGAARCRRPNLDHPPTGRLARAGARGRRPPRPPPPAAAPPPLRLEAGRDLGRPQTPRPGRVRRQGGGAGRAQKKAEGGAIDLWFLDQSGFAPTLPTGSRWSRLGTRLVVPFEAPQGRRVNVVGALAPYDPAGPRFVFETRRKAQGRDDAAAHLAFVRRAVAGLPAAGAGDARGARPCVIVLDNYSVHHSHAVKEALPELEAADLRFCYLPAYSPELNPIEPLWKQVKYQDLPERSHPSDVALQAAVEAALADRARNVVESAHDLPRSA